MFNKKLHIHKYKSISMLEALKELKQDYVIAGVRIKSAKKCRCGKMLVKG